MYGLCKKIRHTFWFGGYCLVMMFVGAVVMMMDAGKPACFFGQAGFDFRA